MNIKACGFASCLLAVTASSALAQEAPMDRPLKVAGEVAVVIPTGDWADASGIGIGVSARITYRLNPRLSFLARPAYVYHLNEEIDFAGTSIDSHSTELLIVGGVQYELSPNLYVGAVTGLNVWAFHVSANGESDSESENRIPLLLDVTYATAGGVIIGGGLFVPNLLGTEDEEDVQLGLMGTVGYRFTR